jgi:hypothetical protein
LTKIEKLTENGMLMTVNEQVAEGVAQLEKIIHSIQARSTGCLRDFVAKYPKNI